MPHVTTRAISYLSSDLVKEGTFELSTTLLEPVPLLGHGFKSVTALVTGTTVVDPNNNHFSRDGESGMNWLMTVVEDRKTLRETLGITASASFASVVSGQLSMYHETEIHQYVLCAVINMTVVARIHRLLKTEAPEDVKRAWKGGKDEAIYDRYGDRIVSEVTEGAQFFVIVNYSTSSEREYSSIQGSLSGAYMSGSGEVSLSHTLSVLKEHRQLSTRGWINGSQISLPVGKEWAHIEEVAKEFSGRDRHDMQYILGVNTIPLQETDGNSWPLGRPPLNVDAATRRLTDLTVINEKAEELRLGWKYIADNPRQFGNDSRVAQAVTKANDLEVIRGRIREEADAVMRQPAIYSSSSTAPPKYLIPDLLDLPHRIDTFAPTIVGRWFTDADYSTRFEIQHPEDPMKNWIGVHPGGKIGMRYVQIDLEPHLPDVGMRYMGRAGGKTLEWQPSGTLLGNQPGGLGFAMLTGIAFEFVGDMKDAYWIEYQVHASGNGYSDIWGNTGRSKHPIGKVAEKGGTSLEAVRLAVWPK